MKWEIGFGQGGFGEISFTQLKNAANYAKLPGLTILKNFSILELLLEFVRSFASLQIFHQKAVYSEPSKKIDKKHFELVFIS